MSGTDEIPATVGHKSNASISFPECLPAAATATALVRVHYGLCSVYDLLDCVSALLNCGAVRLKWWCDVHFFHWVDNRARTNEEERECKWMRTVEIRRRGHKNAFGY